MSCVLANRVVLNIRSVNRDANSSRLPVASHSQKSISSHHAVFTPETPLTSFEMNTLRKMRAEREHSYAEVIDIHDESVDLPFVVL